MEVPIQAQEPIAPDVPEPEPERAPERGPRPRGRTTLLIAAAAVLGVVAGTCTGYLVQAHRAPTALPSLSQPTLPRSTGAGPAPLSAAQDRRVKTDGDLRKLLLRRPDGARNALLPRSADGWLDLAGYSRMFTKPDVAFSYFIGEEFRRAAITQWREGDREVDILLVQYRQESDRGASDVVETADSYAEKDPGTDSWAVPGTGNGTAYVHASAGSYSAEAHAWRGDIALEVWVYDTKPVPKKKIMDLAERQMERL
ncbi:hypothetical protein [Streptomyces gilvus]|uniref:hypothetical protein n=1 Tax=Streptomyces gilvus TaxID=2920937 RepID=UPI001F0EB85D|nr:hypothetical protein [Streptomyces sp. CME 23]MCH5674771.1 hypothetical protein [Streptomyces sp. CME 23]